MSSPLDRWAHALEAWSIPPHILDAAPASPWVHPPELFRVDAKAPAPETPSHAMARTALAAGGTVLDIGVGGGASSLPLVPLAESITGVDEQQAMLDQFATAAAERRVRHREVLGRWPDVAQSIERHDVVLSHHVAYNVAAIGPFVEAMATRARRLVVFELTDRHPQSPLNPLWSKFWGLTRPTEPSAALFVEVVRYLGWHPEVETFERPARAPKVDRAQLVAFVRQRLCLPPESDPDVDAALGDSIELAPSTVWTVAWRP